MTRKDLASAVSDIEKIAAERDAKGRVFQDNMQDFEARVQRTFCDVCESVVNEKLEKYQGVYRSFSQFFCADNLTDKLAQKADLREMNNIKNETASKTDLKEVYFTIDTLYQRLKHISILQTELAKSIVPSKASGSFKATENVNTKLLRRDFIAK